MSLAEAKAKIKDIPISMVVSRYVVLNKRGGYLKALCPFHQDSHPSLIVNDQKGLFKCFSCDAGGDSIAFVQKYKSLGFKEAIIEIFNLLGFPTDDLMGPPAQQKDPKWAMAYKLMERAAQLYRKTATMGGGPAPFKEFLKKRKLDDQCAEKFFLGFAPNNNAFLHYLQTAPTAGAEKKLAMDTALELGLIRTGLTNKAGQQSDFDTFRDRIIFPIWDGFGRIVGFGSRATLSFQKAKYLNSQDSLIFNKKNILYGLHLAKGKIREKNAVILVEGYMDLIALHKHGFEYSVATMGIALSERSLKTLTSLTKNIFLGLDSDEAGFAAMKRMNQNFMKHGILPRFVDFSPHKDPDEFLAGEGPGSGPAALKEKLEKAPCFLDKIMEGIIPSPAPQTIEGKLQILQKVFEELSPLGDSLACLEKLAQYSRRLELQSGPSQIIEAYRRFLADLGEKGEKKDLQIQLPASSSAQAQAQAPAPAKSKKAQSSTVSRGERILITECINHPEILGHQRLSEILEYLDKNEVYRLVECLKALYYEVDESEYPSIMMDCILRENFSLEIREIVGNVLFHYQNLPLSEKVVNKLVLDIKQKLAKEKLISKRNNLRGKQKICENENESLSILDELTQIERQVSDIKLNKLSNLNLKLNLNINNLKKLENYH